jgi:hypothetical protein
MGKKEKHGNFWEFGVVIISKNSIFFHFLMKKNDKDTEIPLIMI